MDCLQVGNCEVVQNSLEHMLKFKWFCINKSIVVYFVLLFDIIKVYKYF